MKEIFKDTEYFFSLADFINISFDEYHMLTLEILENLSLSSLPAQFFCHVRLKNLGSFENIKYNHYLFFFLFNVL